MFVNFNILNQLGSPAINSNTFANRPAAGQTGRLFVSTDTYEIYRDNGTTWDLIGGPGSSTITGSGTATQVAYFTSSQAIGSSANLFWDNTNGFLGVGTAAPTTRIEAVKTDGIGIYANFTTNAGSGSSTTALWAKNVTNSSGFAAVIEETTPNATAGQYPLLIKHSLSSGTAGVGMGTGVHWQLPDDAGTFKTTQLTIETINAAAATYATRYRFNVQSNGSSTPVAYINATGLGIFTATPGAALDVHSTGTIAQFNTTSATGNTYIAFQRTGTGLWRIGDTYNGGANFFELHNTVLGTDALEFEAATNKSTFQAQQTYTTGLARGNYFDYNLSVAAGGSFSSPNAITALTATLDLTLAGNATIPSGARSGLDAYNTIAFTGAGTLTHNQGTQIRAYSNVTAGWAFSGSAVGTITHLAGLHALFPDNSGSAVNVTNNYALLLNDQTANTGTVTYTNRWGVYQEGTSDLNYFNANLLLGSTVNNGNKLQVTGSANFTSNVGIGTSSPQRLLDVRGAVNLSTTTPTVSVTASSYADIHLRTFSGASSSPARITVVDFWNDYVATFTDGHRFRNWSSDGVIRDLMTITGTGNLGLGTSAPSSATWGRFMQIEGTYPGVVFNSTAVGGVKYSIGADAGVLTFRDETSAATRMLLNSSGNVLIGTTSAQAGTRLQVAGVTDIWSSANTLLRLQHDGTRSTIQTFTGGAVGATAINNSGGNVLIGTTTDNGYKVQSYASGQTLSLESSSNDCFMRFKPQTGDIWRWQARTDSTFSAYNENDGQFYLNIGGSGNLNIFGAFSTGAPTGGTAASWKMGTRVAATVVLDTTQYIELDVNGTLYKLAIVT